MTAAERLPLARTQDTVLPVLGDRWVVDAPIGVVTPELRADLVQHKPALAALRALPFVTLKDGPTLPLPTITPALDLGRPGGRRYSAAAANSSSADSAGKRLAGVVAVSRFRFPLIEFLMCEQARTVG
jgi:hypothetical protein